MSRRKEIALVTAGILAGIAVSGPATQAAAGLMANPSSQQFYVNGQHIPMQAYEINGSNYVKLRDVGQTVFAAASPTMPLRTPSSSIRTSLMKWR